MKEYQQRVVDEKIALEEKLVKLRAFLGSEAFLILDNEDRSLLSRQEESMSAYLDILVARIKRFFA
jgi:hypothetical protein